MVGIIVDGRRDTSIGGEIMDTEQERQENLNVQVEQIVRDNPHLMSGGAKRYFRRVWLGYVILAIACVVGIWALTARSDERLRHDINALGTANCISGIQTVSKYNDLVNSIIATRQESLAKAKAVHDKDQIEINKRAIQRYRKDKIIPPTVKECNLPILRDK